MNTERAGLRLAWNVLRAVEWANGGDLPTELFEAVARVPEFAEDLECSVNAARRQAEVLAQFKVR